MIDIEWDREIKDSEKYVLSSVIYYLTEIEEIVDIGSIDKTHFVTNQARRLWQAIENTVPVNGRYDPVLLISSLRKFCLNNEEVESCIRYLNELTSDIHYFSISKYLQILKYSKIKRSLNNLARRILSEKRGFDNFEDLLDEWRNIFFNITEKADDYGYVNSETAINNFDEWLDGLNKNKVSTFFKTGFSALDNKIKYLSGGQLVILASRPGIGKTTFAINVIYKNFQNIKKNSDSEKQKAIGMFSLEMTVNSLLSKLLAIDSNVELSQLQKLADGEPIPPIDKKLIESSKSKIKDLNLLFCEEANVTLGKMTSIIRTWVKNYDLKLVIVDYLQLVNLPESRKYDNSNQYQKIGLISRTLKILAMELNICIFALAQLNRKSEERRGIDKSPILSDLRESGSIEQDADVVLFLYEEKEKEEESDEDMDTRKNESLVTMLKIAKNRHGPVGKIKFLFDKNFGVYKALI